MGWCVAPIIENGIKKIKSGRDRALIIFLSSKSAYPRFNRAVLGHFKKLLCDRAISKLTMFRRIKS